MLKPGKSYSNKFPGFFQELKSTTLTEYFRSVNLSFNQSCISTAIPKYLQRNKNKVKRNIATINSTEAKKIKKLRLEKLISSVGAYNSVSNSRNQLFADKKGLKSWKEDNRSSNTNWKH